MSSVAVLMVRDDGRTFAMDGGMVGLVSVDGLNQATVEVFSQSAALGDGDLVTGQRVGSRTLEFVAKAKFPALNEVIFHAANTFFTPSQGYAIHIKRYGVQRYAANCRLEGVNIPVEGPGNPLTLKLSFLMPEGYFLSEDSFGQNIADIEARCGYPFVALEGGRVYGVYKFATTVYLQNDGDAETFCQAVFTARGSVTNPWLTAGDGMVRVVCTLDANDVMVVDGKTRTVTINGTNAYQLVDRKSRFDGIAFGLGTNTVGFSADVGANLLDVFVYYNKRYLNA